MKLDGASIFNNYELIKWDFYSQYILLKLKIKVYFLLSFSNFIFLNILSSVTSIIL